MCFFTVYGPLVHLTFACRVILLGQRNVVYDACQQWHRRRGARTPQKFVKKIFLRAIIT